MKIEFSAAIVEAPLNSPLTNASPVRHP